MAIKKQAIALAALLTTTAACGGGEANFSCTLSNGQCMAFSSDTSSASAEAVCEYTDNGLFVPETFNATAPCPSLGKIAACLLPRGSTPYTHGDVAFSGIVTVFSYDSFTTVPSAQATCTGTFTANPS